MKYYAVTNDPTELMHYGIKGMKWGVIRTDAQLGHPSKPKKPRSAAYKKAESKLGKMMKSGIKKAEAHWPDSKELKAYKKEINRERRAYKKAEKRFEKHLQLAREGRLKYKGISDSEVGRITDRLALERQARSISGAEKPSFGRRLRESIGEGVIKGVGVGTTSYIDARMKSRGQTTAQIKADKRLDKYYSRDDVQYQKARRAQAEEYYRVANEEGINPANYHSAAKRRQYLQEVKARNKENAYQAEIRKTYDQQGARSKALADAAQGKLDFNKHTGLYEYNQYDFDPTSYNAAAERSRIEARSRKEQERQRRIEYQKASKRIEDAQRAEERRRKLEYKQAAKRIEEAQRAEERRREQARIAAQARADAAERERYRQNIADWSFDISYGSDVAYGHSTRDRRRRSRRGYH